MSTEITLDPFTEVYNLAWSLLEASDTFCAMVREGNRIKFSGAHAQQIKEQVSTADLPEVRIVSMGASSHLWRTSNSSTITRRLSVQLASGDQRYAEALYPLEWAIYRALADWPNQVRELTWNGKPFVVNVRCTDAQHGQSDADLIRGIKGWVSIWSVDLDLVFATEELLADGSGS